jgi:hypothetical protein
MASPSNPIHPRHVGVLRSAVPWLVVPAALLGCAATARTGATSSGPSREEAPPGPSPSAEISAPQGPTRAATPGPVPNAGRPVDVADAAPSATSTPEPPAGPTTGVTAAARPPGRSDPGRAAAECRVRCRKEEKECRDWLRSCPKGAPCAYRDCARETFACEARCSTVEATGP